MHSCANVNAAVQMALSKSHAALPKAQPPVAAVEALSCLFEVAGQAHVPEAVREAAQALGSGLAPLYDAPSALVGAFALSFDKLADIANGKRVLIVPDNAICIVH